MKTINKYKIAFKKVKKNTRIKLNNPWDKFKVPSDGYFAYSKLSYIFWNKNYFIQEIKYKDEDNKVGKTYAVYIIKKDDFNNLYFERLHYFSHLINAKNFIILMW